MPIRWKFSRKRNAAGAFHGFEIVSPEKIDILFMTCYTTHDLNKSSGLKQLCFSKPSEMRG